MRVKADSLDLSDFNFRSIFAEALSGALSEGVGGTAREIASEHLAQWVAELTGATAKVAAEAIAGPLLKVLLHVVDGTDRKLNLLIHEPFSTGVRQAREALDEVPQTAGDIELRKQTLLSSYDRLDTAYTLAKGRKGRRTRFFVRLLQGFIAKELGAERRMVRHFTECLEAFSLRDRDLFNRLRGDLSKTEERLRKIRVRDAETIAELKYQYWMLTVDIPEDPFPSLPGFDGTEAEFLEYREWQNSSRLPSLRSELARFDPLMVLLEVEVETPAGKAVDAG